MNEREHVLVVGTGRVGNRFAQALLRQGVPTTLYDTVSQKPASLIANLPADCPASLIDVSDNLAEGIRRAQAVYICSPISAHFEAAAMAIEAKKAVLCEKPLTAKLSEALALQKMVHQANTSFIVANYYRFNSPIYGLKQAIEQGDIGKIIGINAIYLHDMTELNQETPWRAKAGFLEDGAVHPIDLSSWIMGESVIKVNAMSGPTVDSEHPIDFRINLKYQSGRIAHIWANARAILPVHGAELMVLGTRGTIRAFNKDEHYEIQRKGERGWERISVPQGQLPIDRTVTCVQDYALGRSNSFYPLPGIDEAVESIRILDIVQRAIAA